MTAIEWEVNVQMGLFFVSVSNSVTLFIYFEVNNI
jgi:hypothetical protein